MRPRNCNLFAGWTQVQCKCGLSAKRGSSVMSVKLHASWQVGFGLCVALRGLQAQFLYGYIHQMRDQHGGQGKPGMPYRVGFWVLSLWGEAAGPFLVCWKFLFCNPYSIIIWLDPGIRSDQTAHPATPSLGLCAHAVHCVLKLSDHLCFVVILMQWVAPGHINTHYLNHMLRSTLISLWASL